MTKKRKVLNVDELVIHANDVKIITEDHGRNTENSSVNDPWGFGPIAQPGPQEATTEQQSQTDEGQGSEASDATQTETATTEQQTEDVVYDPWGFGPMRPVTRPTTETSNEEGGPTSEEQTDETEVSEQTNREAPSNPWSWI
ncbi:hypothetical protein [Desertibacillus haloalkaliphilus]|uniref:hypothetical protein n=1 Tax=Desertibacillus haloalkaliphilus TaxID=1328930 RepID=UPI001C25D4C7|nr:hypothetical protein [Desertibacillus haloalkaliphilus]MBU8906888.1 hypothetical protein [Desertibacillus haloalkaliphilus]